MRRKLVNGLLTATVFTCLIVGSGMASSILSSAPPPSLPAKSDFRGSLAEETDIQRPVVIPAVVTSINFDQAFSDAAAMRSRNDTPPVREKFRNVGWTRIIGAR